MKPPSYGLVFLLIFPIYCFFAGCPLIFGQYHFDSWTTDNGLPQNGLRQITQTPDGYLWFTTFDGLVRFDGVRFTTFGRGNTKGIASNRFAGIYCDKDGTLYATTKEGGSVTVYKNGVFTSYTAEQIPGHYIQSIQAYKNGEAGFLAIVGEDNYTRSWYLLHDGKFVLAEDLPKGYSHVEYDGKSGAHWILTPTEVTEIRDGVTTVYDYQIERFDFSRPVFEDSGGGLWIGGFTLARLAGGKIETFGDKDDFPKNADFHSFWEESDGSVWFANGGPSGEGLGLVRYQDGKFTTIGKEFGLSDTSIFQVFHDREGVIWLATNKGLNRLRKKVITAYDARDGLNSSEVYPMYRDSRDNIWVGSTKGLNLYRNGKFEPVELQETMPGNPEFMKWKNREATVQALWEDPSGKMWIGVAGGIFIAENGKVHILDNSAEYHVFAIKQDRSGRVWAATNKGLVVYRDYQREAVYSVKDGLPNENMTTIFEDSQGQLWFGGYGGLSEFKDGKFINYNARTGLTGNHIRTIYEDAEGVLWIGTYGEGLSRFKDGNFVNYKTENGLSSNDVFAIEEDKNGNFWISSNNGIYRVKRQELNDFADKKIEAVHSVRYGKEDGMLNNECNGGRQPASLRDQDGKFWFPTQDGVVIVDPENEVYNPLPPPVVIESATVERNPVDISQGLNIEPGDKNIEINFTGISLIKSEQIRFKYKLEGHDPDWVDSGTRRTAYYSYLPPGNYRFQVMAANSDGVWSDGGAALELNLKPFFYQTEGFYLLCLTIGVFVLFIVWKISVYQLESRERRLAKLVGEKTLELKKANEELQLLANADGLTKLANRRHFENFLSGEWHRAVRSRTEISLILLDIDHFKFYNDHYGHLVGDDCLQKVAGALADSVKRPTDLVARYGGEEFVIVLGGTDSEGAAKIAEQVMDNIKSLKIPHKKSKTNDCVTISLGIATTYAKFEMTQTELIKAADEALYRAKENGRNQIYVVDMQKQISQASLALEEEFVGVG